MWRYLQPDLYLTSIYRLPLSHLRDRGIKYLILDLDNTLVRWDSAQLPARLKEWVSRVRGAGFRMCIVTNNSGPRVTALAEAMGVPVLAAAAKPRRRAFRGAMDIMGARPAETAVVGDQLFTDVLGGKRLGLYAILVRPLAAREFVATRLMRRLERWVLARLDLLPADTAQQPGPENR